MKEDIQKSVIEIIEKSGVELEPDEQQKIVDDAIGMAMNHIGKTVGSVNLADGTPYMRVWARFGNAPELPGIKPKRAALVAFIMHSNEGLEVRTGAWYDGRVVASHYTGCSTDEPFGDVIGKVMFAIRKRADGEEDTGCDAFLSIIEQPDLTERSIELLPPPGLLDLVVGGDIRKAVERIREVEYGTICDMCRSDLDLVRIVVDAGQACDGVLASFAGKGTRLANELPMVKQEAKSYAIHHANELLESYRFKAAQDKMTGWATW
ncbi:hypothetical protein [Citrobacter amalonaticus]|uniref:hypothetical protein n=1 Tax=Citrobacter amalonaticus TaxID=35703 RepID=UPI00137215C6|nr:hypothetical protein [Citrobacter amalonaticus]MZL16236.1 hypothetical protein [Citrobacter amalonaticus]